MDGWMDRELAWHTGEDRAARLGLAEEARAVVPQLRAVVPQLWDQDGALAVRVRPCRRPGQ